MVNEPDRLLSLAYAGAKVRPRLEAAFALDTALADVLRTVREPMIARIRLAWWREQLEAVAKGGTTPPEPILATLTDRFSASGLSALSDLPDAWDVLLEDPLNLEVITRFAALRGAALASVFPAPQLTNVCAYWSMADFAFHSSDERLAAEARVKADDMAPARLKGLPRALRVLAGLARDDLARPERRVPGSPARLIRAFRHAFMTS